MVENENKARKSGADDFHLKPVEKQWLLDKLNSLGSPNYSKKLLLIDDDEVSRYLFRGLVVDTSYKLVEAAGGHDGLQLAVTEMPDVIFLDLNMPDLNGYEVLRKLKANEAAKDIPRRLVHFQHSCGRKTRWH